MTKKVVGIDCGSTLRKYVWQGRNGSLACVSTASTPEADVFAKLSEAGITHAALTGIGKPPAQDFLQLVALSETADDPISLELRIQVAGLNALLRMRGGHPGKMLVVSIGTGTSYTLVGANGPERLPIGNPIGGGFIAGMVRQMDITFDLFNDLAMGSLMRSDDLLFGDVFPATAGTLQGSFVVSHFAKTRTASGLGTHSASVISTVATAVARDLMLYRMLRTDMPETVVFIGTPVSMLAALRVQLERYSLGLGFKNLIPANGEYAGAIGAMYIGDGTANLVD